VCENKETIGKVLIVSGTILFVAAFAITTAGFGPAGIAAGSLAASVQGIAVVGSSFAIMQSLGALGVFVAIGIAGAVTVCTGAAMCAKTESGETWAVALP
jgi:hypothetical protein